MLSLFLQAAFIARLHRRHADDESGDCRDTDNCNNSREMGCGDTKADWRRRTRIGPSDFEDGDDLPANWLLSMP